MRPSHNNKILIRQKKGSTDEHYKYEPYTLYDFIYMKNPEETNL